MGKTKKSNKSDVEFQAEFVKLGKRIKALRVAAGYTSAMKFAFDNGLSAVQMARWEQGRNVTLGTLLKLAKTFKISLSELVQGV